ncbi:hypothetical protein T10_11925 [Trichinella papuae]|uniref:PiggyBac transposable element-derived protein 3 n=1 Tax=Trichinella papuae TaxID=268474 RepID=A0A0V1MQ40_9BILA|nr:hypothetical protein T10_11925 [Trichinella papuae]
MPTKMCYLKTLMNEDELAAGNLSMLNKFPFTEEINTVYHFHEDTAVFNVPKWEHDKKQPIWSLKKDRGSFDYRNDGKVVYVVKWHDNSRVTAASSWMTHEPNTIAPHQRTAKRSKATPTHTYYTD